MLLLLGLICSFIFFALLIFTANKLDTLDDEKFNVYLGLTAFFGINSCILFSINLIPYIIGALK